MKIICIGRNYEAHARELNNPVPDSPVVFMKPPSALLVNDKPFYYPDYTKDVQYECELVLKICRNGRHIQPDFAMDYFEEVSLGIDFTARDLQQRCKEKGHPWEIAKGFDGSAVLGKFISKKKVDLENVQFSLLKNKLPVQQGQTRDLIFSFSDIICYVSKFFRLQIGDYIYTGTPSGVGPVAIGDTLQGILQTKSGEKQCFRCDIK